MELIGLVDPNRAGAVAIAAGLGTEHGDTVESVASAVAARLSRWTFASRPGPSPLEQVDQQRAGNCIDLASLLCSAFRRLAIPGSHVLLGSWKGAFPALIHAWSSVYDPEHRTWLLIDPRDMRVRRVMPVDIERELVVTALYDDSRVIVALTERAQFWSTVERETSKTMPSTSEPVSAHPSVNGPITIEEQGEGFYAVLAGATGTVFITNDTGRHVLELCDGATAREAILADVRAQFVDVPEERLDQDIEAFLESATSSGLVTWKP